MRTPRSTESQIHFRLRCHLLTRRSSTQLSTARDRPAYSYALIDIRGTRQSWPAPVPIYRRQLFERNQFNPKLGISFRVTPFTTIRAAAFRTLHRATASNQTVEPTQVAGFSQLFADAEGVEAKQYGVAIDQKFGRRMFAGLEYAPRDLLVPVTTIAAGVTAINRLHRTEQFGRAYYYWAPVRQVSTSVEYIFERFGGDNRAVVSETVVRARTHRVPLGVKYFALMGMTAQFSAERIDQSGTFFTGGIDQHGEDRFWLFNGAIGYRLPNRLGRITFEARNLFDADFNFQDTDSSNPRVRVGRVAALRFTLGV